MTSTPEVAIELPTSAEPAAQAGELEIAAAELAGDEPLVDAAIDPVEYTRIRLSLEDHVPDVTIAASLAQIGVRTEQRERWLAAFGSPLGKHLALRGGDLNASLDVLLAIAPKQQS